MILLSNMKGFSMGRWTSCATLLLLQQQQQSETTGDVCAVDAPLIYGVPRLHNSNSKLRTAADQRVEDVYMLQQYTAVRTPQSER